jgi:hypothetical protein
MRSVGDRNDTPLCEPIDVFMTYVVIGLIRISRIRESSRSFQLFPRTWNSPPQAKDDSLYCVHTKSIGAMKLDQAVAELLRLDPTAKTTVSSAGGGGCSSASTAKITTTDDNGTEKRYFMKSGSGEDAETMFRGPFQNSVFVLIPRELDLNVHSSHQFLYTCPAEIC